MASPLARYTSSPFQGGPAAADTNDFMDQLTDARDFAKKVGRQKELEAQRVAQNISAADLMQLGGTADELRAKRDSYFASLDPTLVDVGQAMKDYDARMTTFDNQDTNAKAREANEAIRAREAFGLEKEEDAYERSRRVQKEKDHLDGYAQMQREEAELMARTELAGRPSFNGLSAEQQAIDVQALTDINFRRENTQDAYREYASGQGFLDESVTGSNLGQKFGLENAAAKAQVLTANEAKTDKAIAEKQQRDDFKNNINPYLRVGNNGALRPMTPRELKGRITSYGALKAQANKWRNPTTGKKINTTRWENQDGAQERLENLYKVTGDKDDLFTMITSVTKANGELDLDALDDIQGYVNTSTQYLQEAYDAEDRGMKSFNEPPPPPQAWLDYLAENHNKATPATTDGGTGTPDPAAVLPPVTSPEDIEASVAAVKNEYENVSSQLAAIKDSIAVPGSKLNINKLDVGIVGKWIEMLKSTKKTQEQKATLLKSIKAKLAGFHKEDNAEKERANNAALEEAVKRATEKAFK